MRCTELRHRGRVGSVHRWAAKCVMALMAIVLGHLPDVGAEPGSRALQALATSSSGPTASWDAYKLQAAQRLVQANPDGSYVGTVPEPLLAIPVLEIELDANGGVRRIRVLRQPSQARDTVQLAMAAVRRAAPFGSVRHLPRPWKFVEVFLFDDNRRFMPATLDR